MKEVAMGTGQIMFVLLKKKCANLVAMRKIVPLAILLLVPSGIFAKKISASAWQNGTLQNLTNESASRTVGVINDGHGVLSQKEYTITHYFIESENYLYEADRTMKSKHDKQLMVTVHGPIKFALDGNDFYVQDEQGKTHKLSFVMKSIQRKQAH